MYEKSLRSEGQIGSEESEVLVHFHCLLFSIHDVINQAWLLRVPQIVLRRADGDRVLDAVLLGQASHGDEVLVLI